GTVQDRLDRQRRDADVSSGGKERGDHHRHGGGEAGGEQASYHGRTLVSERVRPSRRAILGRDCSSPPRRGSAPSNPARISSGPICRTRSSMRTRRLIFVSAMVVFSSRSPPSSAVESGAHRRRPGGRRQRRSEEVTMVTFSGLIACYVVPERGG